MAASTWHFQQIDKRVVLKMEVHAHIVLALKNPCITFLLSKGKPVRVYRVH